MAASGEPALLKPFGSGIWVHDGADIMGAMGFHYPTRMVVIRLSSGGLWVCSPTQLTGELKAAIDDLGPVVALVAPNTLHHTFIAEWQSAYPAAALFALPQLLAKRPDLTPDGEIGNEPAGLWAGEIDQVVVTGNTILTEAVFFHRASGVVLFTDLLQNLPKDWYSGWRRIIARLDLMLAPEPTVPRKFRMAFRDRQEARAAIARILDWPAEQVLMAHGRPVTRDGQAFLRRAFAWLLL